MTIAKWWEAPKNHSGAPPFEEGLSILMMGGHLLDLRGRPPAFPDRPSGFCRSTLRTLRADPASHVGHPPAFPYRPCEPCLPTLRVVRSDPPSPACRPPSFAGRPSEAGLETLRVWQIDPPEHAARLPWPGRSHSPSALMAGANFLHGLCEVHPMPPCHCSVPSFTQAGLDLPLRPRLLGRSLPEPIRHALPPRRRPAFPHLAFAQTPPRGATPRLDELTVAPGFKVELLRSAVEGGGLVGLHGHRCRRGGSTFPARASRPVPG